MELEDALRTEAATRLQCMYRARAARRAATAKRAELEAMRRKQEDAQQAQREEAAALAVQCAYRRYVSRQEVKGLRQAKAEFGAATKLQALQRGRSVRAKLTEISKSLSRARPKKSKAL